MSLPLKIRNARADLLRRLKVAKTDGAVRLAYDNFDRALARAIELEIEERIAAHKPG